MRLRFQQGYICDDDTHKQYNIEDETDMQILCKEVNDRLLFLKFELDDNQTVVKRIKELINYV